MKKTYQKPKLYAEGFELVEHIAGGCITGEGIYASMGNSTMCYYEADNIQLYTNGLCSLSSWMDSDDSSVNFNDPSTWKMKCYNTLSNGVKAAFHS